MIAGKTAGKNKNMTGIVDYNAGNIPSVARALDALGCEYVVSKSPKELQSAQRLIFPGVGDARYAMEQLKNSGFDVFLKEQSMMQGVPVLGICLGSQIIFGFSEEGSTTCLGLLDGEIQHFSTVNPNFDLKVPHMGWNDIYYSESEKRNPCGLFEGIAEGTSFYFVHSYVIQPKDKNVPVAFADYGIQVPAAVRSENIYAVQFHPEKSGEPGLRLLHNFTKMSQGGGNRC